MIDKRLRDLIYPHLKMELNKKFWKNIDYLLDNAYFIEENGEDLIVIPPVGNPQEPDVSLQFNAINGMCVGICWWSETKKNGVKL